MTSARRMAYLAYATVLLVPLAPLGCSDDPGAGTNGGNAGAAVYGLPADVLAQIQSIDTALDASEVVAGTEVAVSCTGQPGNVIIPKPTFQVTPTTGIVLGDKSFRPDASGQFAVACTLNAGKMIDPTPAVLVVTAGPIKTIETALNPGQISAGAKSQVTCTAKDAFANEVAGQDWTVTVTDPEIAVLDAALQLEGHKAGKTLITCSLADVADAKSPGAELTVVAGKATELVAHVEPETIDAGASAKVSCTLEDGFGNQAEGSLAGVTLDVPDHVKVTGLAVTTTTAGEWPIACALANSGLKSIPATLEVLPGAPLSWVLVAKPDNDVYVPDDTIKLSGLGVDEWGNDVPGLAIALPAAVTPEGVTPNGGGKSYTFDADGIYTFTATLEDHASLGAQSLDLKCDSTGPLVLISSPERAATLEGSATILVKGMVVDDLSATKSYELNGQMIELGDDGSFELTMEAGQGMNTLVWIATDEWDNEHNGVQSFYYSTKWYPMGVTPVSQSYVNDGIGVWLSQVVIDSGKHDHSKPKDIATVFEIVLGKLDFAALLGAAAIPIKQGTPPLDFDGSASVENIKMGNKSYNDGYPAVSLTVINGGLHMIAFIPDFSADMVLKGKMGSGLIPIEQKAFITAEAIAIELDLLLKLNEATGKITGDAKNVTVKLQKFDVQLSGVLGFLTNWLLSAGTGLITPLLEAGIAAAVEGQLGPQLASALEGFALSQTLELNPFIGSGPAVKLTLSSVIGQLSFKPTVAQNGGIILGLDATMQPEKMAIDRVVLGSIGRAACLQPGKSDVFNPGLKFPLEAGLADDFVNQLLFALWGGGLLQIEIGEESLGSVDLSQFGVSNLSVVTDFWLPPMLTSCGAGGKTWLQVGDLRMNAKLNLGDTPVDIVLFASMQATAKIAAQDNPKTGAKEIGFALESIDFLELEVVAINAEAKGLQDLFLTMIKTIMLPKLVESLGSGLGGFELPAIDLSSFDPSIPEGTELALSIQQIDNQDGYTYLRGEVK